MRIIAISLLATTLAIASPQGGEADEMSIRDETRAVISAQLEAFRSEDLAAAYEFAAPLIQRRFVDPDTFGDMVRSAYPMVWDPAETEFLEAEPRGAGIVQRLRLVDQAGRPFIAEYMMIRVDGEWRIAGVSITEDNSYGA